jgi:glyoxylase-like metal-dependent hydrolase (beta-lactamase superfamily II)
MKISRFSFSAFQELTYVIWDDETLECAIIDPGCYYARERQVLENFIAKNNLKVKYLLVTHIHLDHYFGVPFVARTYGVPVSASKDDEFLLEMMSMQADMYGTPLPEAPIAIGKYLQPGDTLYLGNEPIEVRQVPGHSPGSLSFYLPMSGCVFCGDALFEGSIGRTDLPGGDFGELLDSIRTQLFTLPAETVVYPGHGGDTTIAEEMRSNPFLQ